MAIVIRGTGKAVPRKKVTNDELALRLDTSDEWIRSHTGIRSRYIAEGDETSAFLGTRACLAALQNAAAAKENGTAVGAEDISLLVVSTATPDNNNFPSDACLIQRDIGAQNAMAFDVAAACSGFLHALDIAGGLMERHGWRYALVCGAETLSRITDWTDRSSCVLFGDGSGAVLLENTDAEKKSALSAESAADAARGLGSFVHGAVGTGADALYCRHGGKMIMDGHAVYNFAVGKMVDIIRDLMEKESLALDDISWFVCHQANARIILSAAKRLGFSAEKFVLNMEQYGNMSSACIPIALHDMSVSGQLKAGQTIVSAAFGAGLTWSGCVIRW
ncbi:MAG: ketoacyl-ACP synthase III [Bacteroides sp.]|nr:ketoacyl-ACP synthase III [Prevotella sp.]MCM1407226.1 ketoacyl-ACP synthase III [Treponema brennaborense]MCM1470378.1 ketoacyl-ACP synthase III [Bacteroides sp.]